MKTIFAEIYNKILELFQLEKSENSSECAANRLQVILMHDRTKLDPLIMSRMREELIGIFSKYVVIDKEKLEIDLKNEGDAAALMLNIPIVRAKTEEELEELRRQLRQDEEKVVDDDDDVQEADYIIVEEPENEEAQPEINVSGQDSQQTAETSAENEQQKEECAAEEETPLPHENAETLEIKEAAE